MKKYVVIIMVLGFIALVASLAQPYHSYSGSLHHLRHNGDVVISSNYSALTYNDADSVLTKTEQRCLDKLSDKYDVKY